MPELTRVPPVLDFVTIHHERDPQLYVYEMGMLPYLGEAVDEPIVLVKIRWHFKGYDMLNEDELFVEGIVEQEHYLPKYVTVPAQIVKEMVLTSYNESREVYHSSIKEKGISNHVPNLPDEMLNDCLESLCKDINEALNAKPKKG